MARAGGIYRLAVDKPPAPPFTTAGLQGQHHPRLPGRRLITALADPGEHQRRGILSLQRRACLRCRPQTRGATFPGGSRDPAAAARPPPHFRAPRDNPPPPVRRVHCATPGSGSRARPPAPAAAGSAAGCLPAASWPCDDGSCCRPPAAPAAGPAERPAADRCRSRIDRQAAAAHRRAGEQQIIDLIEQRHRAGEAKLPHHRRTVRTPGPDANQITRIEAHRPRIAIPVAGAGLPCQRHHLRE